MQFYSKIEDLKSLVRRVYDEGEINLKKEKKKNV
jgi:hypothetical protein